MELLRFKTNITPEEDLRKATPLLKPEKSIPRLKTDTANTGYLLNVSGEVTSLQAVKSLLQQTGDEAGFVREWGVDGGGV